MENPPEHLPSPSEQWALTKIPEDISAGFGIAAVRPTHVRVAVYGA